MKSDRPLIASVLALAAGLGLLLSYCTGSTSLSAAYPLSSSTIHMDMTTTGSAALGGIALIAVGLLLMAWALLAAIVGQLSLLSGAGYGAAGAGHGADRSAHRSTEKLME